MGCKKSRRRGMMEWRREERQAKIEKSECEQWIRSEQELLARKAGPTEMDGH